MTAADIDVDIALRRTTPESRPLLDQRRRVRQVRDHRHLRWEFGILSVCRGRRVSSAALPVQMLGNWHDESRLGMNAQLGRPAKSVRVGRMALRPTTLPCHADARRDDSIRSIHPLKLAVAETIRICVCKDPGYFRAAPIVH